MIKIYSIADGSEKYNFRRATFKFDFNFQYTQISCIAFNPTSTLLAVSASREGICTVHIFNMEEGKLKQPPSESIGVYEKAFSILENVSVGSEARSFCVVRLSPPTGFSLSCVLNFSSDSTRIFTMSNDGKFQHWKIPTLPLKVTTTSSTSTSYKLECERVEGEDHFVLEYCDDY